MSIVTQASILKVTEIDINAMEILKYGIFNDKKINSSLIFSELLIIWSFSEEDVYTN